MSDKQGKLWQVDIEVSYEMVVEAETLEEAIAWAEEHYRDGLDDISYPGVYGSSMSKDPLNECPPDWKHCSPYNASGDKTVDQYFEKEES